MAHYVYKYVFDDEIIYIGKNDSDLVSRIKQHENEPQFEPYLEKSKIYYLELANSRMSDVVESELIRRYKPKLNTKLRQADWYGLPFIEPKWELLDYGRAVWQKKIDNMFSVRERRTSDLFLIKQITLSMAILNNCLEVKESDKRYEHYITFCFQSEGTIYDDCNFMVVGRYTPIPVRIYRDAKMVHSAEFCCEKLEKLLNARITSYEDAKDLLTGKIKEFLDNPNIKRYLDSIKESYGYYEVDVFKAIKRENEDIEEKFLTLKHTMERYKNPKCWKHQIKEIKETIKAFSYERRPQ